MENTVRGGCGGSRWGRTRRQSRRRRVRIGKGKEKGEKKGEM